MAVGRGRVRGGEVRKIQRKGGNNAEYLEEYIFQKATLLRIS